MFSLPIAPFLCSNSTVELLNFYLAQYPLSNLFLFLFPASLHSLLQPAFSCQQVCPFLEYIYLRDYVVLVFLCLLLLPNKMIYSSIHIVTDRILYFLWLNNIHQGICIKFSLCIHQLIDSQVVSIFLAIVNTVAV